MTDERGSSVNQDAEERRRVGVAISAACAALGWRVVAVREIELPGAARGDGIGEWVPMETVAQGRGPSGLDHEGTREAGSRDRPRGPASWNGRTVAGQRESEEGASESAGGEQEARR